MPKQIATWDATILIVGLLFTFIEMVFVSKQPEVVPVTVYIVEEKGETETEAFVAPIFQVYDVAPVAVKVEVLPEQIVVEEAVIFTVGVGLTFKLIVFVSEQPEVLPVTVYIVEESGESETEALVAPVFHEYDVAPLAINVAVFPIQILLLPDIFIVGVGKTLMLWDNELVEQFVPPEIATE